MKETKKIFAVRLPESTHERLKMRLTMMEAADLRKMIVALIEDTLRKKEDPNA